MSNNRGKVSISVDLIPQIYELSAVKCLNAASTIALVLKIFKEVTSKVDVYSRTGTWQTVESNKTIDWRTWRRKTTKHKPDMEWLKLF